MLFFHLRSASCSKIRKNRSAIGLTSVRWMIGKTDTIAPTSARSFSISFCSCSDTFFATTPIQEAVGNFFRRHPTPACFRGPYSYCHGSEKIHGKGAKPTRAGA